MDSDVAYVRHVDEESGYADSSVFDQRYSAHQDVPSGYSGYGLEASVISAAHHQDEEFDAPPHVPRKDDGATLALHALYELEIDVHLIKVVASYWIGLVGPLVIMFVGHKTIFIQHHAYQGLWTSTILWIIPIIFVWNWIAFLVLALISIACITALTAKALYDMKTEHCFKLPLIGSWSYHMAEKAVAASRVR